MSTTTPRAQSASAAAAAPVMGSYALAAASTQRPGHNPLPANACQRRPDNDRANQPPMTPAPPTLHPSLPHQLSTPTGQ